MDSNSMAQLADDLGLIATAERLRQGNLASLEYARTVLRSCLDLSMGHCKPERLAKYRQLSRAITARMRAKRKAIDS